MVTLTKGLAKLLAEQGIRVNSVAPGPIWTPLVVQEDADSAPQFGQDTPLGRPGQPADLAATYVLLASADSSYTTGAIYAITGGELTA
ncbi:hypothetical protein HNQ08_002916 [Deinococcus humi]|uniref:Uncharacterized protein n=1 Tax=Deinococcus humi TaxID=662880 RepID=A0A7W8NE13_9DEIO|nr:hypothetical protein [Deinococcus humi]GGO31904.1 hypothetical protein GCM10008949_28630 [Deinococcus humi]